MSEPIPEETILKRFIDLRRTSDDVFNCALMEQSHQSIEADAETKVTLAAIRLQLEHWLDQSEQGCASNFLESKFLFQVRFTFRSGNIAEEEVDNLDIAQHVVERAETGQGWRVSKVTRYLPLFDYKCYQLGDHQHWHEQHEERNDAAAMLGEEGKTKVLQQVGHVVSIIVWSAEWLVCLRLGWLFIKTQLVFVYFSLFIWGQRTIFWSRSFIFFSLNCFYHILVALNIKAGELV